MADGGESLALRHEQGCERMRATVVSVVMVASSRVFPEWRFEWQTGARQCYFRLVAASVSQRLGWPAGLPGSQESLS
jgi:hypothetical protein